MSTTTHKSGTQEKAYRKKWFAILRMVCYLWILVLLFVVNYYEPEYHQFIEPAIHAVYFAVGGCAGKNHHYFTLRRKVPTASTGKERKV